MSDATFKLAVIALLAVIAFSLYSLVTMVASAWLEKRLSYSDGAKS